MPLWFAKQKLVRTQEKVHIQRQWTRATEDPSNTNRAHCNYYHTGSDASISLDNQWL